MSKELFMKILDEVVRVLPPAGIVALSYGGESLLHPQFKEFAEMFQRSRIRRRQIVTNALLLDSAERRQVLIDNFAEIAFSIHNVSELPKVLENVKAFKDQCRLEGDGAPYFRANLVEEEFRTRYQIGKVLKQVESMGIEIKLISAISEDMTLFVERYNQPELCYAPFYYMGILWNGDVLPCCHVLSSADWTLGNVSKRSLSEVFEDEPYRRLRMGVYEDTQCARCTIRS